MQQVKTHVSNMHPSLASAIARLPLLVSKTRRHPTLPLKALDPIVDVTLSPTTSWQPVDGVKRISKSAGGSPSINGPETARLPTEVQSLQKISQTLSTRPV